jgi:hypothetical protein
MEDWKAGAFRGEGLCFLMEIIFTLLFKTLRSLLFYLAFIQQNCFYRDESQLR